MDSNKSNQSQTISESDKIFFAVLPQNGKGHLRYFNSQSTMDKLHEKNPVLFNEGNCGWIDRNNVDVNRLSIQTSDDVDKVITEFSSDTVGQQTGNQQLNQSQPQTA